MAERKLHPVLFEERAGFNRFVSLRVSAGTGRSATR
jgi:hypothetical protein